MKNSARRASARRPGGTENIRNIIASRQKREIVEDCQNGRWQRVWEQGQVLQRSKYCITYIYTEKGYQKQLVCKQIDKIGSTKKAISNLHREGAILAKLQHSNILQFDHIFEDE